MTSLSIAATAGRTGVSPHTLRYYERIGLIDPVGARYADMSPIEPLTPKANA